MSKLKGPLFSFNAQNSLSKAISFVRRRGQNIAEKKPEIKDVRSMAQLSWRHMYLKAVALWHALSAAEQLAWESDARPRHMTGFAWFMSQCLRPNPGLYLPLQGGTMSGDIDMAKNRLLRLPIPSDAQEAASKTYVDALIAASLYKEGARAYHNTNYNIPNATTTTHPLNSEYWDTDSIHDLIVNNSRLTCKTAGKYFIKGCIEWQVNNVGKRKIDIILNGAIILARDQPEPNSNAETVHSASTVEDLIVGDYVTLTARQDSGGALLSRYRAKASPVFVMQRIG